MTGGNFVGVCAQGKCVVDCTMQEKPGDHGRCVGEHRYTGCNNANFGTYCVTAQGLELGVCDDSIRLGKGRLNTCVVACKQKSEASSSGDKCTTCAADGSRCYTGVYHGRYDASRAVCVMDCNPQTCEQSNSNCNEACQSCSSSNGCYSTTSLDANVEAAIAVEAQSEQVLLEQGSSPEAPSPSTAPLSTGGCSSNGNCRAHEVCDRSICVCDENYEKKGGRCVKVSDTILGVNSTVFAIVLPIVLLLLFGLLAAFCLFSSKSGESNDRDRGINHPGRRKQKNSELAAPGTE